jgi:transcriptional regulator with XRE-family HTH domain
LDLSKKDEGPSAARLIRDKLEDNGQQKVEVAVMTVKQAHSAIAPTEGEPWDWPAPANPGDLSRRLAARRTQLRLTVSQVALRAGVEPRYLKYLENFPGHPNPATLRRLATALHTTPSVLLGAGQEAPPGRNPAGACWGAGGRLEPLTRAECYRLLGSQGIGRIAFDTAAGTAVLPVNYAVAQGTIVIRTGTGSLIAAHGDGRVSFQVDHFDLELGQGWSVLMRGDAHRVLQPGESRNLTEGCDLRPWPAGEHDLFVRIVPVQITGRRIRSQ